MGLKLTLLFLAFLLIVPFSGALIKQKGKQILVPGKNCGIGTPFIILDENSVIDPSEELKPCTVYYEYQVGPKVGELKLTTTTLLRIGHPVCI